MDKEIKLGIYIHFKGNKYEVIGTATHSESLEELVVYRALKDNKIWIRPISMWDELVEHNEQLVKRFTHEDETFETSPPIGININSSPKEKVALFLSYFVGRDDVYAKRFENKKTGKNGYVPDCLNSWNTNCP